MKDKKIIEQLLILTNQRYITNKQDKKKKNKTENIEKIKGKGLENVVDIFFEGTRSHQRWVNLPDGKATAKIYKEAILKNIKKFNNVETFEDVIEKVESIFKIAKPKTEAILTIYDLSLYIGVSKGILPEKYIYIHRGAEDGARSLKKILNYIDTEKEYIKNGKIEVALLPKTFKDLKPYEIENYLCKYKNELGMIVSVFKIDETDKTGKIQNIIEELLIRIQKGINKSYILDVIEGIDSETVSDIGKLFYNQKYSLMFEKVFKAYIGFYLFTKTRKKNEDIDIDSVQNEFKFFLKYNKII